MKLKFFLPVALSAFIISCEKYDFEYVKEDPMTFTEIGSLTIGKVGAAEITAFDPTTNRLFVVTNVSEATRIDVVDIKNPAAPMIIGAIIATALTIASMDMDSAETKPCGFVSRK